MNDQDVHAFLYQFPFDIGIALTGGVNSPV